MLLHSLRGVSRTSLHQVTQLPGARAQEMHMRAHLSASPPLLGCFRLVWRLRFTGLRFRCRLRSGRRHAAVSTPQGSAPSPVRRRRLWSRPASVVAGGGTALPAGSAGLARRSGSETLPTDVHHRLDAGQTWVEHVTATKCKHFCNSHGSNAMVKV